MMANLFGGRIFRREGRLRENRMKKLCLLAVSLFLLVCLVGCGTVVLVIPGKSQSAPPAGEPQPVAEPEPEPVVEQPAAVEQKPVETAKAYPVFDPVKGFVPGVLYQMNLEEGKEPIIRGISLAGNVAGSAINEKGFMTEGLRFVFEANEWISVGIDTDLILDGSAYYEEGLCGFVIPHYQRPEVIDLAYLLEITGTASTPAMLYREDNGSLNWQTFIPDAEPGYYDLIIALKGQPLVMVVILACPNETLSGLSDEQLEAFQAQVLAESKAL